MTGTYTINTPPALTQCQPYQITWSGGQAPYFLAVTKASEVGTVYESLGTQQGTSVTWKPDLPVGTSVTLYLTDSQGVTTASAPSPPIRGGDGSCTIKQLDGSGGSSAPAPAPAPAGQSSGSGPTSGGTSSGSGSTGSGSGSGSGGKGTSGSGGASNSSTDPKTSSTDPVVTQPGPVIPNIPASGGMVANGSSASPTKSGAEHRPRVAASVLLGLVGLSAFLAAFN